MIADLLDQRAIQLTPFIPTNGWVMLPDTCHEYRSWYKRSFIVFPNRMSVVGAASLVNHFCQI
ncbi:hypothetical protein BLOT_009292 [Blomia tropicalis]|nr:hypothetical protein BLOT_009292 [Blomia tropicalis]